MTLRERKAKKDLIRRPNIVYNHLIEQDSPIVCVDWPAVKLWDGSIETSRTREIGHPTREVSG